MSHRNTSSLAGLVLVAVIAVLSACVACGPNSATRTKATPVLTLTAGRLSDDPDSHAGECVRVYASQVRPVDGRQRSWIVRWSAPPNRLPIVIRLAESSTMPTAGGFGHAVGVCRGLQSQPLPDLDLPPPFVLVDGCDWTSGRD